jgi:hypothetical protein
MKRFICCLSALVLLMSLTACPFWIDPPGPLPAPGKVLGPGPGPMPGPHGPIGPPHP